VLLRFQARHVSGAEPRICLWEIGPENCAPYAPLVSGSDWKDYMLTITPDSGTTGLGLFIYSDAGVGGQSSINDYADFAVYSVPATGIVLVGYPDNAAIGSTQLLVLHQSFTQDWTGPTSGKHVLVDGMLNGWLVDDGKAVARSAEYAPDMILQASWALSLAGILVLVVLAVLPMFKAARMRARRR
jgi:hypothetical protein